MSAEAPRQARFGWLPHPMLSLLIALVWLLLRGSLEPVHWIAAAALGLAIPLVAGRFLGPGGHVRRWDTALRLAGRVVWDIVRANVTVAAIVLNPRAAPRPAWVRVPLALEQPRAVALLATIVTATPGTVSCVIDESRRTLLVHALDCADPAALREDIRSRYEAPLQEIFG
jgi:multicomponent K+:H+ antiporter subunit E